MPEEAQNFATARARLEEIVSQVRKKDTSLEASLDLLEEGVRLANQCTELIDHADWEAGELEAEMAEGDGAQDGEADGDSEPDDRAGDGEQDEVDDPDASLGDAPQDSGD